MIKRIFISLVCAGLLFSLGGNAGAVEKKSKDDKAKTETKAGAVKKDAPVKKDPAAAKKPATKQFDTFVDENGNGIDDRRENLKNKAVAESQAARAKAQSVSAKQAESKKADGSKKADSVKKVEPKKATDKKDGK
ncbi:MAG TPA: hypothetical protein PK186_00835 [candidate division Zixibacteria bacterium]|nr:hypothetical protein [candidate division Zixibacteria bacterium]MDD4917210.1 hypothetical protein [candidate division Zixibacteria bacterium]MDM7971676.1 hypothetical protein [candidate division Zixibacteria bacterium]HOD65872.1 hypothetical protein [candidate division Zixibacteria bacterium]HPM36083.1 hypothetical protein [candidate division Zixibacteria bacterium]